MKARDKRKKRQARIAGKRAYALRVANCPDQFKPFLERLAAGRLTGNTSKLAQEQALRPKRGCYRERYRARRRLDRMINGGIKSVMRHVGLVLYRPRPLDPEFEEINRIAEERYQQRERGTP